jgi:hypothetical protein
VADLAAVARATRADDPGTPSVADRQAHGFLLLAGAGAGAGQPA